MALTVGDRTIRPLTADEALRMLELELLPDGEQLELLDGVLTRKPVKSPAHEAVKERLSAWLAPGLAEGRFSVRTEACLVVPQTTSLPEPDLMVLEPGQDPLQHPTSALLVVEVAASSVVTDLRDKPGLYAAAGVPEYWVVDIADRMFWIHTGPEPDGYGIRMSLGASHPVSCSALALPALDPAEVFAGLPGGP